MPRSFQISVKVSPGELVESITFPPQPTDQLPMKIGTQKEKVGETCQRRLSPLDFRWRIYWKEVIIVFIIFYLCMVFFSSPNRFGAKLGQDQRDFFESVHWCRIRCTWNIYVARVSTNWTLFFPSEKGECPFFDAFLSILCFCRNVARTCASWRFPSRALVSKFWIQKGVSQVWSWGWDVGRNPNSLTSSKFLKLVEPWCIPKQPVVGWLFESNELTLLIVQPCLRHWWCSLFGHLNVSRWCQYHRSRSTLAAKAFRISVQNMSWRKGWLSRRWQARFFSQEPTEICGPNGSGWSLSALSTLRTSGDILWYEDTLPWIKTLQACAMRWMIWFKIDGQ